MLECLTATVATGILADIGDFFSSTKNYFLVFLGFSLIIFVHELGHFLAAKWCDVRVERFAVGFGRELFGFTRGETRYSFNFLPLGGYVKMLGQEDFEIDKSGELRVKDDPRAFSHKPVGQRMIIVSAGVIANMVFAALIFMVLFMIGLKSNPPVVGFVRANSPAAIAGIRSGDRILEINGKTMHDFRDIMSAIVLADPKDPLDLEIERTYPGSDESEIMTLRTLPKAHPNEGIMELGVMPMVDLTVSLDVFDPTRPKEEQLQPGDRILAVDGVEIDNWQEMTRRVIASGSKGTVLTVERPSSDPEGEPSIVKVPRKPMLALEARQGEGAGAGDLLGFIPLRQIAAVTDGMPADQAGMKAGDAILRWGDQYAPRLREITDSIAQSAGTPTGVTLLRPQVTEGGTTYEEVTVEVTPTEGGVMGMRSHKPLVGIDIFRKQFNDRLIVADIRSSYDDGMPMAAAELKSSMPRGSLITQVNGQPVSDWSELAQAFIAQAGSDVEITWRYQDGPARSGSFYVPHTLGTVFEMNPDDRISKIADKSSITIEQDGVIQYYHAGHWLGAREILKEHVGETIPVEYRSLTGGTSHVQEITVTPEMLDTWRLRIQYIDYIATHPIMKVMREPNPFKAMMIGVRRTYGFIMQVYITLERMIVSKSVGIEQVSGPVGIVHAGSTLAERDLKDLFYFLAIISANLAVINFLPLPIVDGGLFVFLLIEKIKGSPLSLKVQVATQMIGLALIISIFVMVTFNDILRLIG